MNKTTNDSIKLENIKDKGYGISPKLVAQDTRLSIESKAIYMYFSSYCGNSVEQAFPKLDTILHHLRISKDRYYRHLKPLIELGYIKVVKRRKLNENNKWVSDSNLYVLKQFIDTSVDTCKRNQSIENANASDIPCFEEPQNKEDNNINSFNKNNSMYVCLYNKYLTLSNSIKKFICSISNKIDFDLFEKLLVETLNNKKVSKKDAYFITTLKALIEKNIKTISEYEIAINNYKEFLNEKRNKNKNRNKYKNINQNIDNNQTKKTKFHNFTENFIQYSEEELDKIILKSQNAKFA